MRGGRGGDAAGGASLRCRRADEPRWAITGLLHDADYDRWPEEHPRRIVAWLRERGEPEIAQAVVAHFDAAEVPELTPLDKSLLACDE